MNGTKKTLVPLSRSLGGGTVGHLKSTGSMALASHVFVGQKRLPCGAIKTAMLTRFA